MHSLIAENISKYRKSKGWTQEQLGKAAGNRSVNQMNGYERGRSRPSPAILKIIADALDVQVSDLTGEAVSPAKAEIEFDTFWNEVILEIARRLGILPSKLKFTLEIAA